MPDGILRWTEEGERGFYLAIFKGGWGGDWVVGVGYFVIISDPAVPDTDLYRFFSARGVVQFKMLTSAHWYFS